MCTIEQKDVLIEFIAHLRAKIMLSRSKESEFNEDQLYLRELRGHVYSTSYNNLNYEELIIKLKNIKSKYNNFENFKEHPTWLV